MSGNEAEKAYLNLTFVVCADPYYLLRGSCSRSPNCVQGKVSCVSVQKFMIARENFQFWYFPFGGDFLHIVLHFFHVFILTTGLCFIDECRYLKILQIQSWKSILNVCLKRDVIVVVDALQGNLGCYQHIVREGRCWCKYNIIPAFLCPFNELPLDQFWSISET